MATLKERTSPTRAAWQQMKSHPHLSAKLEAALSGTLLTCSTCSQNGVESSKMGWKAVPRFHSLSVFRFGSVYLVFQVQHFNVYSSYSHLPLLRLLRPAQMDPRVRSCHGKAREGLKSKDAPIDPRFLMTGVDGYCGYCGIMIVWYGSPDQPNQVVELNVMGTCRRVARTFRSLA